MEFLEGFARFTMYAPPRLSSIPNFHIVFSFQKDKRKLNELVCIKSVDTKMAPTPLPKEKEKKKKNERKKDRMHRIIKYKMGQRTTRSIQLWCIDHHQLLIKQNFLNI